MFEKLGQFASLDTSEKLVFVHGWFLLGYIRAATLAVSFKRLTASLQHHRETVSPISLTLKERQQANRIGGLVAIAAKYTPWRSLCLTQVLVVQRLLARRGITGQLYLGVRKVASAERLANDLEAHAWLQCDDLIVNAGAGHQKFSVVSIFSWGRS
jgi:hypothetical protein